VSRRRRFTAIARGVALLGSFEASKGKATTLKHMASTLDRARVKHDPRTGHLIGEARAVVDTSVLDYVAYMMHQDSRHLTSTNDPAVMPRYEVVETVNEHHIVVFLEAQAGKPVRNRTFLSSVVCMRLSDEPLSHAVVSVPLEHHPKLCNANEQDRVRAEAMRSFRLTALGLVTTLLEYACWLDVKGQVPKWVTNTVLVPAQLKRQFGIPYNQQMYCLQYYHRVRSRQSTPASATCCSTQPWRLHRASGRPPSKFSWRKRPC
jgi:hypothetical protein